MPRKRKRTGVVKKKGVERLLRGAGKKKLRVSRKAVNRMAEDFEKYAKWIAQEAAQVAKERGHKTITEMDYLIARDAILGREEE